MTGEYAFRIINDLEDQEFSNSLATKLILEEGFRSSLTVPVFRNNKVFAFLFVNSRKKYAYSRVDGKKLFFISQTLGKILHYCYIIQTALSAMAQSFVNLVEFKDTETGNHIKRVANYSRILAEKYSDEVIELPAVKVREIYNFAPIHDIGKVGIPDTILLKPGRLDPQEWEIMKRHVEIGQKIVKNANVLIRQMTEEDLLSTAMKIISDHHEKYDGTGYPVGKKGEEISIEGRIVAIADVFDALTTKRPYKDPFPFDQAVDMIRSEAGKHFDPVLVELFLKATNEIRKVFETYKD
ncbi:HD-GYP domain-containing protein [Pseudothermotoga thermarum]|uniref:HD-GYP domain-containing protein n=1 Tax=Pseudothermotoga thermarum TaxID=119394 RepID=UPI0003178273|nr:HD domain-containing phosphohydrolase [Pseudothermotoga thermarum]